MGIVHDGQDAPDAVHLGVIARDLRHEHKDGTQDERESKHRHERVGADIDFPQVVQAVRLGDASLDEVSRQTGQLRREDVAREAAAELGTLGRGQHRW